MPSEIIMILLSYLFWCDQHSTYGIKRGLHMSLLLDSDVHEFINDFSHVAKACKIENRRHYH